MNYVAVCLILQYWIHHVIVRWTENILYFEKSCKIVSLKQLYLHSFISHFLSSFIRQLQDLRFVLEWQAYCLQKFVSVTLVSS